MDRRELLNLCWKFYAANPQELLNVQEFEHCYSSSKVLDWFSSARFLCRWLIFALQTFDLDRLYLLRFFVQDLEDRLHSSPSVVDSLLFSPQWLTEEQLESLRQGLDGPSRRFQSYFFAQRQRDDALRSLVNPRILRTSDCPVLFEIEQNAVAKELTATSILFPLTSEFRVMSFNRINGIARVKIRLTNDYRRSSRRKTIEWPKFFLRSGQVDLAERLFLQFVDRYPREKIPLFFALAELNEEKGLLDRALDFYFQSLALVDDVPRHRSSLLNNIGILYAKKELFELSLDFFHQCLSLSSSSSDLFVCSSNIGVVYSSMHREDLADEFFERAKKNERKDTRRV